MERLNHEAIADRCRCIFKHDKHHRMKEYVNICNGTPNCNSCDFINFGFYEMENGYKLCWKQNRPMDERHHGCIRCQTIKR